MQIILKSMRERRNMTQVELSRRSGVPQPQISMIEGGLVPAPQIDTMYKLATALRCTVDDLIRDERIDN